MEIVIAIPLQASEALIRVPSLRIGKCPLNPAESVKQNLVLVPNCYKILHGGRLTQLPLTVVPSPSRAWLLVTPTDCSTPAIHYLIGTDAHRLLPCFCLGNLKIKLMILWDLALYDSFLKSHHIIESAFKRMAGFVPGLPLLTLIPLARQILQHINQMRFLPWFKFLMVSQRNK